MVDCTWLDNPDLASAGFKQHKLSQPQPVPTFEFVSASFRVIFDIMSCIEMPENNVFEMCLGKWWLVQPKKSWHETYVTWLKSNKRILSGEVRWKVKIGENCLLDDTMPYFSMSVLIPNNRENCSRCLVQKICGSPKRSLRSLWLGSYQDKNTGSYLVLI